MAFKKRKIVTFVILNGNDAKLAVLSSLCKQLTWLPTGGGDAGLRFQIFDGMKGKTIDIESEFHALLFIAKLST